MPEIKPAYLVAGTDDAKIARTRRRLRERAEREGGLGALELFEAGQGRRSPDVEALIGSLAAISLIAARRYLLADGIESWGKKDSERVADALGALPPETTLVLIAHGKAPAELTKAVKAAGGEVLAYDAPRERELPKRMVADAKELGFELDPEAARLLVERLGTRSLRLRAELERLALWAGDGGRVGVEELDSIIADTSEQAIWSLADAIVEGDEPGTLRIAEQLVSQGEALPRIVYSVAPRLRQALRAARELEAGRPPKEVAGSLAMHPYAAKMLLSRVRGRSPSDLDRGIRAFADLELWSRGGSDYSEGVAMTLALRRAVGAGTDEEPTVPVTSYRAR
ncbi:MAG: DNA polymerase III subunit delta [Actinomycetota bacterium]|nr:DNA polymerase III subunit delta [Actinomycetota bacterium]